MYSPYIAKVSIIFFLKFFINNTSKGESVVFLISCTRGSGTRCTETEFPARSLQNYSSYLYSSIVEMGVFSFFRRGGLGAARFSVGVL